MLPLPHTWNIIFNHLTLICRFTCLMLPVLLLTVEFQPPLAHYRCIFNTAYPRAEFRKGLILYWKKLMICDDEYLIRINLSQLSPGAIGYVGSDHAQEKPREGHI